jgi:hypothetical protein
MEQIEYKAWVIKDEDGEEIEPYMDHEISSWTNPIDEHNKGNILLLQNTGETDIHGAKIFNKDIVFILDDEETKSGWWGNVAYYNGAYWVDEETLLCTVAFRCKVVGNKFEGILVNIA